MTTDRYLPAARQVAQALPGLLAQRGLTPFISRCVLTETQHGHAWLFIVLEVSPLQPLAAYMSADVLDYLSGALHGLPVMVSDSYGLRYAVLLSAAGLRQRPS